MRPAISNSVLCLNPYHMTGSQPPDYHSPVWWHASHPDSSLMYLSHSTPFQQACSMDMLLIVALALPLPTPQAQQQQPPHHPALMMTMRRRRRMRKQVCSSFYLPHNLFATTLSTPYFFLVILNLKCTRLFRHLYCPAYPVSLLITAIFLFPVWLPSVTSTLPANACNQFTAHHQHHLLSNRLIIFLPVGPCHQPCRVHPLCATFPPLAFISPLSKYWFHLLSVCAHCSVLPSLKANMKFFSLRKVAGK